MEAYAQRLELCFPAGMALRRHGPYVDKVFSRIPWTNTLSMGGKHYFQDTAQRTTEVLASAGYTTLSANEQPGAKSGVVSNSEYVFLYGERGGTMATYLASAAARKNFWLQMNTTVTRLVRKGDTVTSVEVEASGKGGYSGTIRVTEYRPYHSFCRRLWDGQNSVQERNWAQRSTRGCQS